MQDGPLVAYASWQLRKHEEHYSTPDLELADLVHTLKIWRHYLMGKRCKLYTDHNNLKYTFTQLDLSLRQWRLLKLIKDYDLGINYHPREANVVADAWSRRSHMSQLEVEKIGRSSCAKKFNKLNLRIDANTEVMEMEVDSTLL
jgi:hypothetical protein